MVGLQRSCRLALAADFGKSRTFAADLRKRRLGPLQQALRKAASALCSRLENIAAEALRQILEKAAAGYL